MAFRSMILLRFCMLLIVLSLPVRGEKYNDRLKIGDVAPAWKDLPGTDGKKHSLADLSESEIVVVVFTCNSCPVATDYEDRICDFASKYGQDKSKLAVVAINVNKIKEDQLPAMKTRAEKKKFPFPYLHDETQQIARDFGAVFTPEVYVLNRERQVMYMGAIDDHSDASIAKKHYLVDAVEALQQGKEPAEKEIVPIGCRVRYARERRN